MGYLTEALFPGSLDFDQRGGGVNFKGSQLPDFEN